MIFLGIDPGTTTIGFALVEKENTKIRVIEYGVIETPPRISLTDKLLLIHRDLQELIETYRPTVAGIEKLFFLRNITNGIDVAQARGVIIHSLASQGVQIQEFTPLQVKRAITGNGRAQKKQMQQAIKMILSLREVPKPDDAADALAIAYMTALQYR
ncbi:crossover junction endodeoxyribonuclease RuvC [Candidatus Gracilibacteria bacterium]|nr:MAG: crossover junction endodeoxyribonuclease RuvC [Candidatus Gracilibacteria bacterium]